MKNSRVQLLDCTLRDGGYVNDWEFGKNNLIRIYERLIDSGVDIVEVGFIDDRRPFDYNRSIFPNTEAIKKIWGCVHRCPPMVVGMIDYGTCDISNIQPCQDSFIDGIRVIFKKHRMVDALYFCGELKKLGYKVFAQLVSVTSYDDEDLIALIELANEIMPYAVSMVDTYGLLNPIKLLHIYEILDAKLDKIIRIGFHAHNNLQLAYANTVTFLERETKRNVIVDGTLFGMGKSAGNAPIELLAHYLNQNKEKMYCINDMLISIDESIQDIFQYSPWGYQSVFYLSAKNECHPKYVEYLKNKPNLSTAKINTILTGLDNKDDAKILYDKDIAENAYREFINKEFEDGISINKLKTIIGNRPVLLMGPGKNIELQEERVQQYIFSENPIRISLNYMPKLGTDLIFVSKINRYLQLAATLHDISNENVELFATSNIEACGNDKFVAVFNRDPLLEKQEEILDNPFLMLLKLLKQMGVKEIACAGLDGYSDREDNYINPQMEYGFLKAAANRLNGHIQNVLKNDFKELNIQFITYSHYCEIDDVNSGAY